MITNCVIFVCVYIYVYTFHFKTLVVTMMRPEIKYKVTHSFMKCSEDIKNYYVLASSQVHYLGMCFIFKHLGGYLQIKPEAALVFMKKI